MWTQQFSPHELLTQGEPCDSHTETQKTQKGKFAPFDLNETQALKKKSNCLKFVSMGNIAVKSQQENLREKAALPW